MSGQGLVCPVLVDRDREVAVLRDCLDEVRRGVGGAVWIVGEAGVGKSRLVRELAGMAGDSEMPVLWGRAVASRVPGPFRPVAEALHGAVRAGLIRDEPALRPYLPVLGGIVPEWRGGELAAAEGTPALIAEAVLRVLRSVADDAGCLVVLEDLQWADVETVDMLEYLVVNLAGERLLMAATWRLGQVGPGSDLLSRFRDQRIGTLVDLAPLADEAVDAMAAACLGTTDMPGDLGRFLRSRAEGIPFFVEELLAGMVHVGALVATPGGWEVVSRVAPAVPLNFSDTVTRRLDGLDASARAVVEAAAVIGRSFDWPLLSQVCGLEEGAVLAGLRDAVRGQLVEATPDGFRFRHTLTRDSVLEQMLLPERASIARRVLDVLDEAVTDTSPPTGELAELAEAAGDRARAAALLSESAHEALAAGALSSAQLTLEHARSLCDDAETLWTIDETLAEVLVLAGKVDQARSVGQQLLSALQAAGANPNRVGVARLLVARAAFGAGEWHVARQHLLGPDETAGADVTTRAELLAGQLALAAGRVHEAEREAQRAHDRARAEGLPALACEALEVLGRCARLRDLDEAARLFETSLALAEAHSLVLWRLRATHELGIIEVMSSLTTGWLDAAREAALEVGALQTVAVVDLHRTTGEIVALDIVGAKASVERCIGACRRLRLGMLPMALVHRGMVHAIAGEPVLAEASATEALALAPEDPTVVGCVWGAVRGAAAAVAEDRDGLREALDTAMATLRGAPPADAMWFRSQWALLRTVENRDGDRARTEVAASHVAAVPAHQAILGYADATAEGRTGTSTVAEARFAAADAWFAASAPRSDMLRHHSRRLVAEAALADGWGDPVTWLREAEAFFATSSPYRAVAGACRRLLRDAGVPVPRRGRGDSVVPADFRALGVTSRELDVLKLVAERLSNRAIAERLHLSPRTIEKHVASLLARTGCPNRSALTDLAHAHDLPG